MLQYEGDGVQYRRRSKRPDYAGRTVAVGAFTVFVIDVLNASICAGALIRVAGVEAADAVTRGDLRGRLVS
jgi:hypothetical protein